MMRTFLQLTGFLLFLLGLLSLILSLVGMRFTFLRFLDQLPGGWRLLIQLFLVFGGMILFYLTSQRQTPL